MKQKILDHFPDEEFVFLDGMDDAIIGVTANDFKIVYSARKILDILRKDMLEIEAFEYFDFNIAGAYMGEKTPIYVYEAESFR